MSRALTNLQITGHYIPDVDWQNIPEFAVITGVNGAGKTQILSAIHSAATQRKNNFTVKSDLTVKPEQYGYVPWQQNLGNLRGASQSEFDGNLEEFIDLCKRGQIRGNDGEHLRCFNYIREVLGVDPQKKPDDFYKAEDFRDAYKDAWILLAESTQNQHISRLFLQYENNTDGLIRQYYNPTSGISIPKAQIEDTLGKPPWDIINQLFQAYGFKYRVTHPSPEERKFVVEFFRADNSETRINFSELSSGEQMIVTLILWSFSEKLGKLKKLLILDEPDAHLHPEMAKMFKEIVCETLVNKFGIQVIMTSHSPTTLCWIDEENIFLMDPSTGLSPASKKDALEKLSAGLVRVQPAFKIVLVEDKDDELFHTDVYLQLAYSGRLPKDPRLIFRSVVTPADKGGGKSRVISACEQWSQFSADTDLDNVLFGLVDKDNDAATDLPTSVACLDRYCHENYLADPVLIFALLKEEKAQETKINEIANKFGYDLGDTLKIKQGSDLDFQGIADEMVSHLVANQNISQTEAHSTKSIKYLNGISLNVPECFFTKSGKDKLLKWFKELFPNGASKLNHRNFLTYLEKTKHIPDDLIAVYQDLLNR
ncbi:AAA family ATPase [Roseovarius sp.]|uniref:AAA family ATPase n=1 Tax=Roseovarius sp. TaxID=1486281 RepID=UPI003B59FE6E